eukprot:9492002-Pyramimonas_sp.AAC.1
MASTAVDLMPRGYDYYIAARGVYLCQFSDVGASPGELGHLEITTIRPRPTTGQLAIHSRYTARETDAEEGRD